MNRIKVMILACGGASAVIALLFWGLSWPVRAEPTGHRCNPSVIYPNGGAASPMPGAKSVHEVCGIIHGKDPTGYRMPGWVAWPKGETVVAIGDSFTYGWGVEEKDAWPAVLESLLGQPVINAGIPGAQASRIADTVGWFYEPRPRNVHDGVPDFAPPAVLKSGRTREPYDTIPVAFVYGIYSNDVWPEGTQGGKHSDAWEFFWRRRGATFDSFERIVKASPVPVWAMVLDRPGYESRWLTGQLEDLARYAGMHVIQVDYPDDCAPLAPDELHPNESCHRAYAAAMAKELT